MRIPKLFFWLITLLIVLLPLSMQWRLIFWGERTTGKVVEYRTEEQLHLVTLYSVIRFEVGDSYYDVVGPADVKYPIGKTYTIFYKPGNPHKLIVWNFYDLFLQPKRVLPLVFLLIWVAFYFSFKTTNNQ